MIEKMKFLSITGPKADIDRVVNQYLAKYEIHLENAMAQLNQVQTCLLLYRLIRIRGACKSRRIYGTSWRGKTAEITGYLFRRSHGID